MKRVNLCNKDIECAQCELFSECDAWKKYVESHDDIKSYAHFSKKVSLKFDSVLQYVMNPLKVSKHGFFPFIHFQKKIKKFRKNLQPNEKVRELYYCSHLDRCVFQRYALFPHLDVYDNVAFGLKLKKIPNEKKPGKLRKLTSSLSPTKPAFSNSSTQILAEPSKIGISKPTDEK